MTYDEKTNLILKTYAKLCGAILVFIAGWFFGDATYFDLDGFGVFIPQIGGFHVSLLGD